MNLQVSPSASAKHCSGGNERPFHPDCLIVFVHLDPLYMGANTAGRSHGLDEVVLGYEVGMEGDCDDVHVALVQERGSGGQVNWHGLQYHI